MAGLLHLGLGISFGVGIEAQSPVASRAADKVVVVRLKPPPSPPAPRPPQAPPPASTPAVDAAVSVPLPSPSIPEQAEKSPPPPATSATVPSSAEQMGPVYYSTEAYYFHGKELTEKPHVLQDVTPILSLALRGIETQSVILRLLINENGDIDRIHIDQTQLSDDMVQVVTAAFSHLKFEPGKIGQQPVKSQLKIEVLLENTEPIRLKQKLQ